MRQLHHKSLVEAVRRKSSRLALRNAARIGDDLIYGWKSGLPEPIDRKLRKHDDFLKTEHVFFH